MIHPHLGRPSGQTLLLQGLDQRQNIFPQVNSGANVHLVESIARRVVVVAILIESKVHARHFVLGPKNAKVGIAVWVGGHTTVSGMSVSRRYHA